jgi:hypothetical protein
MQKNSLLNLHKAYVTSFCKGHVHVSPLTETTYHIYSVISASRENFNKFRKLQPKAELFKNLTYSMLLKLDNSMN